MLVKGKGGVYLALSAITVSGGGRGSTEKENQAVLVLPGSYIRGGATRLAKRILKLVTP